MAAEFDKTSFGIQRRRRDAAELANCRQMVGERIGFVKNPEQLERLHLLMSAIEAVQEDLKD